MLSFNLLFILSLIVFFAFSLGLRRGLKIISLSAFSFIKLNFMDNFFVQTIFSLKCFRSIVWSTAFIRIFARHHTFLSFIQSDSDN